MPQLVGYPMETAIRGGPADVRPGTGALPVPPVPRARRRVRAVAARPAGHGLGAQGCRPDDGGAAQRVHRSAVLRHRGVQLDAAAPAGRGRRRRSRACSAPIIPSNSATSTPRTRWPTSTWTAPTAGRSCGTTPRGCWACRFLADPHPTVKLSRSEPGVHGRRRGCTVRSCDMWGTSQPVRAAQRLLIRAGRGWRVQPGLQEPGRPRHHQPGRDRCHRNGHQHDAQRQRPVRELPAVDQRQGEVQQVEHGGRDQEHLPFRRRRRGPAGQREPGLQAADPMHVGGLHQVLTLGEQRLALRGVLPVLQVLGAVEAEHHVPGFADPVGTQPTGTEEPREVRRDGGELVAPVLEVRLATGRDPPRHRHRDRFCSGSMGAPGTPHAPTRQPTSGSQLRCSSESRMCIRNSDAVDPSNARWS